MAELKAFFVSLNIGIVYLVLLLGGGVAMRLKPSNAASLFIWCCSLPVTVYCYVVWIYASGGANWSPLMFVVNALALSQVGWLGGALALAGVLIKADFLKKVGLWVSICSVAFYGLFLTLILTFGYGSS
ncbi:MULTISPECIES: hypothetical protein [Pseudomonas]|uniref:hypothetical protein n=1 Tax=Pseudomonas TaxID=286 RepID=UPI001FF3831C|nr:MULTISPECIES: hypothetical protein [Pseudomonas]